MFSCVVLYPYSLSLLFTCIALFPTLAEYQPVYSPLLFYLLLDYDCVQIVSLSRSRSTFRRTTSRWCVSPVNLPVGYGAFATDRKSTRLNSSHLGISYAVFCLKKKILLHYTLLLF